MINKRKISEKTREKNKKRSSLWYYNNIEKHKLCCKKWYEEHKEGVKQKSKEWKEKHPDRKKELNRKSVAKRRKERPDLIEYDKKWKKEHRSNCYRWESKYKKTHRQKINETAKNWYHNSGGRLIVSSIQDKRHRELGSNLLNNWFNGCERHHITKEDIICIPKKLHKAYWHRHSKPETMNEINLKAWEYMEASVL